jgi:hypothetical protein
LEELIDAISNCPAEMNPPKQWVFVFDQINTLFTKGNLRVTDIPVLSFPFNTIRTVMRQGWVISVISASANNDAPIAGKLDGFVEYNHSMTMTTEELLLGFTALVDDNGCPNEDLLETTISLTNGVPLYASLFLGERYKCNEENFCSSEIGLIQNAWKDLLENASLANTKEICDNAIAAYCAQPSPKYSLYDKNYFYSEYDTNEMMIYPLVPIVTKAIRYKFWDELQRLAEKKFATLNAAGA